jgi:transposase
MQSRDHVGEIGSSGLGVNGEERSPEARLAELEAEVKALRRRNEQLEMDREILKKAAAFFAKESE